MSIEKRKSKRVERNTSAALVSVLGTAITDCVLKDISATGARLAVEVPEVVPDYFFLKIEEHGQQLSPKCRVRWRIGNEFGVEFFRQA